MKHPVHRSIASPGGGSSGHSYHQPSLMQVNRLNKGDHFGTNSPRAQLRELEDNAPYLLSPPGGGIHPTRSAFHVLANSHFSLFSTWMLTNFLVSGNAQQQGGGCNQSRVRLRAGSPAPLTMCHSNVSFGAKSKLLRDLVQDLVRKFLASKRQRIPPSS